MYMPLSTSGWEIWQVTLKDNGPSWPVRKQLLPHWPLSLQQGKPPPNPRAFARAVPSARKALSSDSQTPSGLRLVHMSPPHRALSQHLSHLSLSHHPFFGCKARDLL